MMNKIFQIAIIQILAATIGAVIYSFIADAVEFDMIIVGFAAAVVLPVMFISKFAAKKLRVYTKAGIIITGLIAVMFGFMIRVSTQAYILYDLHFFPEEKAAEIEEGSYISDEDVKERLDEELVKNTGYPSYAGAFVWYLNNTVIKDDTSSSNSPKEVSFVEAAGSWITDLGVGLIALATSLWGQLATLALVCPQCKKEKKEKFFVMAPPSLEPQIIQEAKAKNFQALKGLYAPQSATEQDFISLKAWICENCKNEKADVDFVVTKQGRPTEKMTRIPFSANEFGELQKIFQKG